MTTTLNQFMVLSKLVQLISRGLGVHLVATTKNQFMVLGKLGQLITKGLGVYLVTTTVSLPVFLSEPSAAGS